MKTAGNRFPSFAERGNVTENAEQDAELALLRKANALLNKELGDMRGLAFRDQLTGLYSRRYLTDHLLAEIEEACREGSVALALCDIDDFKAVNDVRGHQAGDIAIACIADIIDDMAGGQPVLRWGGEELLLVLLGFSSDEAFRLCEAIRRAVSTYPIDDGAGTFTCRLTFGLCAYDGICTFDDNFARVDRALYHGKETGKNRCVFPPDELRKGDAPHA